MLGSDISGTVEQSRAPTPSAQGDEVFGFARTGAYAEFAASPAQVVAKKPAGLSHEQAAAIPVAGLTAWQALFDRGGLQQRADAAGRRRRRRGRPLRGAARQARRRARDRHRLGAQSRLRARAGRRRVRRLHHPGRRRGRQRGRTSRSTPSAARRPRRCLPTVREGGVIVVIAGGAAGGRGRRARRSRRAAEHEPDQPSSSSKSAELVASGEVRVEIAEHVRARRGRQGARAERGRAHARQAARAALADGSLRDCWAPRACGRR